MLVISKDSETRLLEKAYNLKESPEGYFALYFHFSKLKERARSSFQIKIAINVMVDLFNAREGTIFHCQDSDIFIVYKGEDKALLERAIFQLRYLYIDDPLAYHADDSENEQFCSVYMLDFQWKEFFAVCNRKVREKMVELEEPSTYLSQEPLLFTPSSLARIEADLVKMDVSSVLRNQVCAVITEKELKPIFDEVYINIAHLRKLLAADIDITSNAPLFRYLTEKLDKYVLNFLIANHGKYNTRALSINLNVKTIFSDEFLQFCTMVRERNLASPIIEIHIADAFSDIAAFTAAKDVIQRLGCRVCVDGLTYLSFPHIDRKSLGFDLAKLQWSADLEAIQEKETKPLLEAIIRCGANRIILCRCDSQYALDYGKALGISLFQGRFLDRMMHPASRVVN